MWPPGDGLDAHSHDGEFPSFLQSGLRRSNGRCLFTKDLPLRTLEHIYNAIWSTVGYGMIPFLRKRTGEDTLFWRGRLGRYAYPPMTTGSPRIWFHAVSVGEVAGAVPTIHALRRRLPRATLFLTTGTPQGFRFAMAQLPQEVSVFPFPLDLPAILKKAFQELKPDLYVAMESEFWPNLFRILRERQIPSLLLNGRLSLRSARRYALFKSLFLPVFQQFRYLAMLSETDRQNVIRLGAPPERVQVLGSSKYDGLPLRARPESASAWRTILDIPLNLPVVVGGSLRRSECIGILKTFQSLLHQEPETVGIFAPRHLQRIPEMAQWLEKEGIPYQLLTDMEKGREKRRAPAVLVDRIGILFELYSLGDLIFCGGTLEPIGGHNILEPAAWKKPVFYGPSLQKVIDEHNILHSLGGSFPVRSIEDLLHQWTYWIQHREELKAHGDKAREALQRLTGAAERQAALILDTLSERQAGRSTGHE